jgi:subtilisin family serine protease
MTAPACVHDVVAVGAVYSRSFGAYTAPFVCREPVTAPDEIACFSNSSTELDLLAAGAPVQADGLDEPFAGTSVAAAQASAAAAVLLAADPSLTPDALLALLQSTGAPVTDARNRFTIPRIDLAAALAQATGRTIPLLPPPPGLNAPVPAPHLSQPAVPRLELSTLSITFGAAHQAKVAITFRPTRRGAYRGVIRLVTDDPAAPKVAVAVRAMSPAA